MSEESTLHIFVDGSVQGVGYRWFVQKTARAMKLGGWVRNLDDGKVEVEASGSRAQLDAFLTALQYDHPWAQVDSVETTWLPPQSFSGFEIRD